MYFVLWHAGGTAFLVCKVPGVDRVGVNWVSNNGQLMTNQNLMKFFWQK